MSPPRARRSLACDDGCAGADLPPALSSEEAAALAKAHGLIELGSRPPFGLYVRNLWKRRSFLWTLSQAEAEEKNSEDRLGVLWTVLNPLLLVCSYFLIFGLLFDQKRGVPNFIGFLSVGVVIFGFSSTAMTKGTRTIINNTGLVRALRFPERCSPCRRPSPTSSRHCRPSASSSPSCSSPANR